MLSTIKNKNFLAFTGVAIAMFLTVVLCRPLMPIDETRYMSVAWEMWMRHDWFAPLTRNFEPYHQKPPMMFWMINAFWQVFGVSRWAGTVPLFFLSFANLFLIKKIYEHLFPHQNAIRVSWMFLGSLSFLFYATLIMFDFGMCFFTLLAILCFFTFLDTSKTRWMILMGLVMGMGVLMKGPVAYLYVLFPVLLAPLWSEFLVTKKRLYGSFLLAVLVSVVPVLLWLIPVLAQSDNGFAFWLVWNQTAGRVTGNFSGAHVRPFYFYLMLLPLCFLPWAFFPSLWKNIKSMEFSKPMKFLGLFFIPPFIAFSLISGKQLHYLVPLVPSIIILMAYLLKDVELKYIVRTSLFMAAFFITAHIVTMNGILKNYDLRPMAAELQNHQDQKIAFASNYQAELGFYARLEKPVEDINIEDAGAWLNKNPKGSVAVIRYKNNSDVAKFHEIMDTPYRGGRIGIFQK